MMVKDAKYVNDLTNENIPATEPQVVAFKATNKKEEILSKMAQVKATSLNNEEITLIIKRFKQALNGCKDYNNKAKGKSVCFMCGNINHFIANGPDNVSDDQENDKKGKKVDKKKFYNKECGAYTEKEWDSNRSSSDFDDEGLATIAFDKSSLFAKENHTCLLVKGRKVFYRTKPKYTYSSDDNFSDYEDDIIMLFIAPFGTILLKGKCAVGTFLLCFGD
jgi:predicted Zn-ribbon and HTH transcriptional regulator